MKGRHKSELTYRREVDGLRAVAIIPVMLFHAGFESISGGYVGVDVFFVVSGYLITSIILREMEDGRYSILGFYERRARRILPALVFVLVACLAVAWAWMLPLELRLFGQSLAAVQLFASNIYFWQTTDYFSPSAEELPLLHTWSLAVEEQYYVLFPLVMILLWRYGRRHLAGLTLLLAVISLAISEWGAMHHPISNFYLLPTRGWELLAGSLLAVVGPELQSAIDRHRWLASVGSLAGITMIAIALATFDKSTPFPSTYALLPVIGSVLIIAMANPATLVGRVLATRPMVGVGLVSYSAYLWHQPVLVFSRFTALDHDKPQAKLALVVVALALAVFSWHFVERPFRERRLLSSRSSLFATSAVVIVVLYAAGMALELGDGYPSRGGTETPRPGTNEIARIDNGWCFYSIDTIPRLNVGQEGLGCVLGDKSSLRRGLLVGDSFAGHFEPFWDLLGKRSNLSIESITTNWCFPSLGESFTGPKTSRAYRQCRFNRRHIVAHLQGFDFVIVAADWSNVLKQGMLDESFAFIKAAGLNDRPVIVMPTPRFYDKDEFRRMKRAKFFGAPVAIGNSPSKADSLAMEGNRHIAAFSDTIKNVTFLKRDQVFQIGGVPSALTIDGATYSLDGSHISVYGSRAAAEQFAVTPVFSRIRAKLVAPTKYHVGPPSMTSTRTDGR